MMIEFVLKMQLISLKTQAAASLLLGVPIHNTMQHAIAFDVGASVLGSAACVQHRRRVCSCDDDAVTSATTGILLLAC
jgi:hypothetical protein